VVQAYNAMPANLREAARVQSVTGAYSLLRTHAERYPDLPLDDDLRLTMEWALVFLDTGKLQGSPALQKLAQVINAEIALEKAQRTAQEAATAFAAAKKAGSKELNKLKTIEDILQRLNAGVKGTGTSKGKVFTVKSTPEQAAQVVPHLRYDAAHQTLRYIPKSVKLEGSDVPLEGIHALAQLIKQMPEARLATQAPITPSNTADDMAGRRNAQSLCSIFAAAQATGSTEFAHLKTVEAVIQRLNAGVKGGQALGGAFKDKTFVMKTTPEETAAAKRHLKWDLAEHTLIYNPEGMTPAEFHRKLNAQQANLPPTSPSEVSDAQAQRTAQALASIYAAAVATGSKDIDQLQSLDAVINRLTTTGMIGGPGPFEGKRIYTKTKPRENEAAKPYLRYDSFTKTLSYSATPIGGSRSSSTTPAFGETRPQSMPAGRETRHRTFSLEGDSASSPDRARRNAEIICTVFNMAVASGAEKVQDVTSVDRAVQLIMTGVYGGGIFREVRFSVDGTPEKAAAAKPFLTYDRDSRSLRYVANTRPPPCRQRNTAHRDECRPCGRGRCDLRRQDLRECRRDGKGHSRVSRGRQTGSGHAKCPSLRLDLQRRHGRRSQGTRRREERRSGAEAHHGRGKRRRPLQGPVVRRGRHARGSCRGEALHRVRSAPANPHLQIALPVMSL
jgi:hypothetical protein